MKADGPAEPYVPVGPHDRVIQQVNGRDFWASMAVDMARRVVRHQEGLSQQLDAATSRGDTESADLLGVLLSGIDPERIRLAKAVLEEQDHLFPDPMWKKE